MVQFPLYVNPSTVPSRLRSGEEVFTSRPELEAYFGIWSDEPELSEDGRATLLLRLPTEGALFLTPGAGLLLVRVTPQPGVFRARLFVGAFSGLWPRVAVHEPSAVPGQGSLPRFWIIREAIAPASAIFGIFDIQEFSVVGRGANRTDVAARVARANTRGGCATGLR